MAPPGKGAREQDIDPSGARWYRHFQIRTQGGDEMGKRSGKASKAAMKGTALVQQPTQLVPVAAANAEAARAQSFPVVARRVPDQGPDNIAASWKPVGNGAGELYLAYEGPLAASAETLLARTGTLRAGGQPWSETRDVRLTRRAPGHFVGVIAIPTGAPVEAVELAFHTGDAWDNGGRAPLGFYEWNAREQRIEVR